MRRLVPFTVALLVGAAVSVGSVSFAADINFGLTITGEVVPGVYGHVVLGNGPPPPVVYARPMVIAPPPPGVVVRPIYLHVPPDYARHWRLHCREFHACNRPVYFVRSAEYAPGFNMERWRREHPQQWRAHEERARVEHARQEDRAHDRGPAHDRRQDHDRQDHRQDHDDNR